MAGVGAGLSSMKCGRLHSLERNFEGDAEVFWTILHKTIVLCKIASFTTIASLDKAYLLVKKSGLTTSGGVPRMPLSAFAQVGVGQPVPCGR